MPSKIDYKQLQDDVVMVAIHFGLDPLECLAMAKASKSRIAHVAATYRAIARSL